MSKVLTSRFVETAKAPASGRIAYADAALPGFDLRVTAEGKRSFSFRFRSPVDRKQKRLTWAYPAFSLSEARSEAEKAIRGLERGEVPGTAVERTEALPEHMAGLCDAYIERYLKKSVRRWKAAVGEVDNHIRLHLGDVRLDQISKAHVRKMLSDIEEEYPVAANRALSRLRAMFNWAAGQDMTTLDPTRGIRKPTKERPVSRVLSDDELVAIWKGCDALAYPARQYVRFLILCGQRRDDVRCMTRSEVDGRTWVIPAERYKGDRQHLVPLTDGMLAQLSESEVEEGYVFSLTNGEKPYGNLVKPKRALDKASKVTGWTLHDIRRTVRTGFSKLGIRPDVAERVIGHSVGGKLRETYDLYSYREEKLRALAAWQDHLFGLMSERKDLKLVASRP